MSRPRASFVRFALPVFVFLLPTVHAQTTCPAPQNWIKPAAANLFNEQQEIWLGDAIADFIERRNSVINDPSANAYLEVIGRKLLAVLPPSQLHFRFVLIESSDVNGFSVAGGRIYITRKLIANARSEDEVAGVLAHEIGHIITHQNASEISDSMRRLLGVTSVGDKADIYDKFRRLMDAERDDTKHRNTSESDADQNSADRVAVYAMAAAGYQPQSYAAFWDRSFYVEGKTGNSLSDFFGITKPSQKRLRQLRQLVDELPKGCGSATTTASDNFREWQKKVVANQRAVASSVPVAGQPNIVLDSPPRMELQRIRFSRDGRYLFAQDESSISVFQSKPLKFLWRIDADNAKPAEWTPDSAGITFHTPQLHMEEWNIAQHHMTTAHEIVLRDTCIQTVLSPDGRTLACVSMGESGEITGYPFNLSLVDTATNQVVFQKRSFATLSLSGALSFYVATLLGGQSQFFPTAISQDGNSLVLGLSGSLFGKIAFDLRTRTPVTIGHDFGNHVSGAFSFAGDAIAGEDLLSPGNSGWFSYPEGKRLGQLSMRFSNLFSVAKGNFLLTRDPERNVMLMLNLVTHKAMEIPNTKNLDLWENRIAMEGADGAVLVGEFQEDHPVKIDGREMLPLSPLGSVRVAKVSPDGKYLALSGRSRGAVWSLEQGRRLFLVRGFSGASFQGSKLYLDFPKYDKTDRHIVEVDFTAQKMNAVSYTPAEASFLRGDRLEEWKDGRKSSSELTVKDPGTGSVRWTRSYQDSPQIRQNLGDRSMIATWSLASSGGKQEARSRPELAKAVSGLKDKDSALLVEVLSPDDGSVQQSAVLTKPSASLEIQDLDFIDGTFLAATSDNRVLLLPSDTGHVTHQVFGSTIAADSASRRFCVRNRGDEATVYDIEGQELAHYQIGVPIRFAKFQDDGRKLLLLGSDYQIRVLTVGQPPK